MGTHTHSTHLADAQLGIVTSASTGDQTKCTYVHSRHRSGFTALSKKFPIRVGVFVATSDEIHFEQISKLEVSHTYSGPVCCS